MTITVETMRQGTLLETTFDSCSDDASKALDTLDGRLTTALTVQGGARTLLVGGGPDRFTVTLLDGDGQAFDRFGESSARGEEFLVIGGQQIEWPRRLLVSRDDALLSITQLVDGTLDLSMGWEPQA